MALLKTDPDIYANHRWMSSISTLYIKFDLPYAEMVSKTLS